MHQNQIFINKIFFKCRPEQKENKEGDDKEKTAEQDKNDKNEELEKDKDKVVDSHFYIFLAKLQKKISLQSDEKTEKTENKDKEEAK